MKIGSASTHYTYENENVIPSPCFAYLDWHHMNYHLPSLTDASEYVWWMENQLDLHTDGSEVGATNKQFVMP